MNEIFILFYWEIIDLTYEEILLYHFPDFMEQHTKALQKNLSPMDHLLKADNKKNDIFDSEEDELTDEEEEEKPSTSASYPLELDETPTLENKMKTVEK